MKKTMHTETKPNMTLQKKDQKEDKSLRVGGVNREEKKRSIDCLVEGRAESTRLMLMRVEGD